MEQLDRPILTFEAQVERDDGSIVPFVLRVGYPDFDDHGGHFCLVDCRFVEGNPIKMYGADEEQACELAIRFVRQRVYDMGARVVDRDGSEISIPEIEFPGSRRSTGKSHPD